MKTAIKVGDSVSALFNGGDVTAGRVYTVIGIDGCAVVIKDDVGDTHYLSKRTVELVAAVTPETFTITGCSQAFDSVEDAKNYATAHFMDGAGVEICKVITKYRVKRTVSVALEPAV